MRMKPESAHPPSDSGFLFRVRHAFRGTLVWYGFVLPPLFLILVFIGYPTAMTFQQSVVSETPGGGAEFVGLYHFERLLQSNVFWGAVGNTVLLIGLGTLFFFMVKAMARIQMPERPTSDR